MPGVPYRLRREGVLMTPDPHEPLEAEGVLNPGSARTPDGRVWLLPRMVAAGNRSRIGLAEVLVTDGRPTGVRRHGVVLAPDEAWERSSDHGGVEDPRVTWLPDLGVHVMTYVAFGPLGPRTALAVSTDLRRWRRLGPVQFGYEPDLGTDLNLFFNKDVVFFPEPVPDPRGRECYAILHRPMWSLAPIVPGRPAHVPPGMTDPRPGIWISYVPVEAVRRDITEITRFRGHRVVALPAYGYESVKIGAGPPPLRVPEGWLLLHHGVCGSITDGWEPQTNAVYAAGAMLLDPADPGIVLDRTTEPLLAPGIAPEQHGVVPNVVFPTAIEQIDGTYFVFYGMADSTIGVAVLEHTG